MKKIILSLFCVTAFLSCHKCLPPEKSLPAGTKEMTGTLHYDNFPDGWGLYYQSDDHESLILKNNFSNADAQYLHYKQYVNQHTTLRYLDSGQTGCFYGIGKVCGYRAVDVVILQIR